MKAIRISIKKPFLSANVCSRFIVGLLCRLCQWLYDASEIWYLTVEDAMVEYTLPGLRWQEAMVYFDLWLSRIYKLKMMLKCADRCAKTEIIIWTLNPAWKHQHFWSGNSTLHIRHSRIVILVLKLNIWKHNPGKLLAHMGSGDRSHCSFQCYWFSTLFLWV